MVTTLVEGAYDREGSVREEISNSLCEIGSHEPHLVLSACASFLDKNPKVCHILSIVMES